MECRVGFAAEAGKWDIVKVLLERGAAVTVERHTKSVLMMAAHAEASRGRRLQPLPQRGTWGMSISAIDGRAIGEARDDWSSVTFSVDNLAGSLGELIQEIYLFDGLHYQRTTGAW